MISFLMAIVTAFSSGKKKLKDKAVKLKLKHEKLRKSLEGIKVDENVDTSKKTHEKKSIKTKAMTMLTAVIAFFEMLPVFFSLMSWAMVIICALVLVVIIFTLMALLASQEDFFEKEKLEKAEEECYAPIDSGGTLAWSEEELASRGAKLTDAEKNLYRLGILAKNSIQGYGGGEVLKSKGISLAQRTLSLMGITSIENSFEFRNGNKDIFKYASGVPSNNYRNGSCAGYGFMGLCVSFSLEHYAKTPVPSNLRQKYPISGGKSYDAQFVPFGVYMSAKHQTTDLKANVNRSENEALLTKVAKEWGIVANVDEFKGLTRIFLAQNHYHGAQVSEYEYYMNWYAAVFAVSSDTDSSRSFSNYAIETKKGSSVSYAEGMGGSRPLFLGKGNYNMIDTYGGYDKIPNGSSNQVLYLNGKKIETALWRYVGEHAQNKPGFKKAWYKVVEFGVIAGNGKPSGGGKGARVLNFHYGLNSYLQAKRVETALAKKMNIVGDPSSESPTETPTDTEDSSGGACGEPENKVEVVPGKFKATPGKGQATIDGMTTEEYVAKRGSATAKAFASSQKKYWGKSAYLEDANNVAKKNGYVDKKFGVPYYGQSKDTKESWGYANYVAGEKANYFTSACMVYSYAYSASALTGKLINPPEMATILHVNGALSKVGIATGKLPDIFKQFGLKGRNASNFDGFDATLDKGGVVVIRTKPGPEGFTNREHFQVVTGKEKVGGKNMYHMFTSSSSAQSKKLYTLEQVKRNMGMGKSNPLFHVWKEK